ncbi:MAG: polyprenyl synthetase family protein, partial [Dietzia maris]
LGVFGDPEVTGNPSVDDPRESKRTLLLARATALAPRPDAEFLLGVLGTQPDAATLERARSILVESGAVVSVEAEIDALTTRALDAVASDAISDHGRDTLRALAEAATRRRA